MAKEAARLFLFSPSESWTYCGGATLICADSLEEAISYGNDGGGEIAEGGRFVASEDLVPRNFCGTEHWVFIEEFILAGPRPAGIVFSDANYA